MSTRLRRGLIALATVTLALFSGRAADAQTLIIPTRGGTAHASNPWVSGAQGEIVNRAMAEHRLEKLQAKLNRDAAEGDWDAVARHDQQIKYLRYRITVDNWLIRKLAQQDPGYYPLVIDEMSRDYIAQVASPGMPPAFPQPMAPDVPMNASPTFSVTIVNAEAEGAPISFSIDGLAREASAGSRQSLVVPDGSSITFDAGGSIGQRRYRLTPGVYEFRSTAEGRAFYKVSGTP